MEEFPISSKAFMIRSEFITALQIDILLREFTFFLYVEGYW